MPSITNTTKLPLTVSLPGGKKLRLGPLQSGQVTGKSLEHPPLAEQIQAGLLEVTQQEGRKGGGAPSSGGPPPQGRSAPGGGGVHHTGDR